ncbi:MAG TPA: hypothetical protein VGN61_09190 [Verrucomicrobiae bacterium]
MQKGTEDTARNRDEQIVGEAQFASLRVKQAPSAAQVPPPHRQGDQQTLLDVVGNEPSRKNANAHVKADELLYGLLVGDLDERLDADVFGAEIGFDEVVGVTAALEQNEIPIGDVRAMHLAFDCPGVERADNKLQVVFSNQIAMDVAQMFCGLRQQRHIQLVVQEKRDRLAGTGNSQLQARPAMRRPKSLGGYRILRGSQELGSDYFSLGFHCFYTQFYTQPNADSVSRFEGKGCGDNLQQVTGLEECPLQLEKFLKDKIEGPDNLRIPGRSRLNLVRRAPLIR